MNAAELVMNAATSYWVSRCVHVVAELGVADAIGDGPVSLSEISSKVGARPGPLGRVMRLLISHGVFAGSPSGYEHTEASRLLRSDDPRSLRPYARMIGSPLCWQSYGLLEHSVRTGDTAVSRISPDGFFGYFKANPDEARVFDAAMASKAHEQIGIVLGSFDFSRFSSFTDVGGGQGHLLKAILDANPSATGVLFDLPHVVGAVDVAANGRMKLQSGDFFKDDLPVTEAYLLMEVLHDWPDPEAIAVLSAIRRAAPASARVVVIENVVPEGDGPHFSKGLDITMLTMTGGLERTPAEYDALFASAGWERSALVSTPTVTLLEAVPK